ncbi:triacylglycerol lipase [Lophium mytilinum]|uniref:Triacylglycerol lipase n=1 Tax=Lophium mytilinum TaxID=390894 RepID=A0A6A6Q7X2_9PEZI|nr:triacylglycerol lipase [Lophium mytilinum]
MAAGVGHESLNPLDPVVLPKLDPKFVEIYNKNVANTLNKPIDLNVLRKVYSRMYGYATAAGPECAKEYELEVPGWSKYPGSIAIRIYEPHGEKPEAGWPVHFDFHGGGWGLGDLETESHICRHICVNAGVIVVDVDYRLVPEYPFPVGVRDCEAVLRHVLSKPAEFKINPSIITFGGVSAGACIALIVNHLARDAGIPIKGVIVGTPTVADISTCATASDSPYPSIRDMEFAPLLNWARLKWFDTLKWESLEKDDSAKRAEQEKDVSWFRDIIQAPNCEGLANITVIMTAECDPLRDEGEAYGRMIEEKGNKVVVKRFKGVPHPFQHMDAALDQAKEFIQDTVDYVIACQ